MRVPVGRAGIRGGEKYVSQVCRRHGSLVRNALRDSESWCNGYFAVVDLAAFQCISLKKSPPLPQVHDFSRHQLRGPALVSGLPEDPAVAWLRPHSSRGN